MNRIGRWISGRLWSGPFRGLSFLLLLLVALTGIVAGVARHSARTHQLAVERALSAYADLAAWEFARYAREDLQMILDMTYKPLERADVDTADTDLPSFRLLAQVEPCGCPRLRRVDFFFRLNVTSGELETRSRGNRVPRAWVIDTVRAHLRTVYEPQWRAGGFLQARWPSALLFANAKGARRALSYRVSHDSAGRPAVVYGFAFQPDALGHAFNWILERRAILPPSVTRGYAIDSVLAVAAIGPSGTEIYRSPSWFPSQFVGVDTLDSVFGGLSIQAGLARGLSAALSVDGLASSSLSLFTVLLVVTAGLVVLVFLQVYRAINLTRARAAFISGVSHELRTPMAQIRMFVEMLRLGRVRSEEERERWLTIIDREARRLTQLVDNVLQFSRSERDILHVAPEPVELATEVREIVRAFRPILRSEDIRIELDLEQDVVALVDRGALHQIMLNLLDNASKYGPPAQTITVGTGTCGTNARLWVDDEGPGIPPRERQSVLEPFRRLANATNATIGGSGIGLAVVHELVRLNGGRIWIEDAPLGGARVTVEMPMQPLSEDRGHAGHPVVSHRSRQGV